MDGLAYVTKDMVSERLRRDTDADDFDVDVMIAGASAAVKDYLDTAAPWQPLRDANDNVLLDSSGSIVYAQDSNGDFIVDSRVENAVLYLVGCMYDDRDGQKVTNWNARELPQPVQSLLTGLRQPVLA